MSRLSSPFGRILGSFLSWGIFTYAFLGLYQSAGMVIGLGGFCASGGPYVIETECPDAVILFAPGGIFGMFLAVAIGLFVAQGFGVLLTAWAWPILFVGLAIQFFLGAASGVGIGTNIFVGVLFVLMGLAPLYLSIRSGGFGADILGSVNVLGQRFATGHQAQNPLRYSPLPRGEEARPTPTDWALSIGVWLAAVAVGGFGSIATFMALAGGAPQ